MSEERLLVYIGISRRRFYDWKQAHGEPRKYYDNFIRTNMITNQEKEAIIDFYLCHPSDGYRRCAYMMIDQDIAYVQPSSVYRVLSKAGVMRNRKAKESKKGDDNCRSCRHYYHPNHLAIPNSQTQANKRVEGKTDKVVQILLQGLKGPINGKKYSGLMVAMGTNDDEWVGSVTTYIRRTWGNVGESVPPHQVKRVRTRHKDRKNPWTDAELKKK